MATSTSDGVSTSVPASSSVTFDSVDESSVSSGDEKTGCLAWISYDPYSGCLTDHYTLGQVLGKGAYGEVRAAKLKTKSQLFSKMCVRCYFSKQSVDAIVSAPDLDNIMESFRGKHQGKKSGWKDPVPIGRSSSSDPPSSQATASLMMLSQNTMTSRGLGMFKKKSVGVGKEAQVIPDDSVDERVRARLSTASVGIGSRMSRSLALQRTPSLNNARSGNQSFVTSESFIKTVCSYDESKLRERPSPNDALRRMMTKPHLDKSNLFEGMHLVEAWTFAVKCMKKAALVDEETSLLLMIDQRIATIRQILDGTATDDVLKAMNNSASIAAISTAMAAPGEKRRRSTLSAKRMSFAKRQSQSVASIPMASVNGRSNRSLSLIRNPLLLHMNKTDKDDPLSLDFYDGNKVLYKNALEIEIKELTKRKVEVSKDLRSVPEAAVLKELKLLALCRHKNILYLVEAFEDERWMYVVVERCYGDFTSRYGKSGRQLFPSTDIVCRVIYQLLLALQHMHRLFVIHRDLKPENILFKNPEHPMLPPDIVVGDFGMAVQLQHRGSVCTDLAGSAAFMSPETWSKCYQNFKSDVWAVGVVTYEMMYCSLPFHATSHPDIPMRQVKLHEFCDLAYKLGTVGIRLAQVVCDPDALPHFAKNRTVFVGNVDTEAAREPVRSDVVHAVREMLQKNTADRKNATQLLALEWFRKHLDKEDIKKD